jgi:cytochrome c553
MTGRSTTFLAWMMAPLGWMMQGMMKKLIQKDIEDLKAYCEAETLAAG